IERQITASLMISGAYVGNKGTHLYDTQQVNQLDPRFFSLGESLLRSNIDSTAARSAGLSEPLRGFVALFGSRATVAQALRRFPQFLDVNIVAAPYANSSYNSFQFKLDKRFSQGFAGTVAYTWSKFLSDGVGFTDEHGAVIRQNHYQREKALYATDQPHIL